VAARVHPFEPSITVIREKITQFRIIPRVGIHAGFSSRKRFVSFDNRCSWRASRVISLSLSTRGYPAIT
jgi:hypothetical protein